ncbi:MAG: helix-turn-helix domain-containing protein [Trebonia sp.]
MRREPDCTARPQLPLPPFSIRYNIHIGRYRMSPTPQQESILAEHCAHARYVWNLAVEQHSHWRPGRNSAPGYLEQCRQLTAARAEHSWPRNGSQMVQQQALRDFAQAMTNFFSGTHRLPSWRKTGRIHKPAMFGVRVRRIEEPREPSPLPLRSLQLHQQC